MFLPPQYRNYWLDLGRREKEYEEQQKKETQAKLALMLRSLGKIRRKP